MHITLLGIPADQARLILRALPAYECAFVHDASELAEHPDTQLCICPQEQALSVLHWMQHHRTIPVLLVADGSNLGDLQAALAAGAEDYVLSPLRKTDLVTRVRLLFAKHYPSHREHQETHVDAFVFTMPGYRVTGPDIDAILTQKEFALGLLLFNHIDHPLSRAYIQESIWGSQEPLPTRTIDTHISRVRTKLGLHPARGYELTPVYGFGYRLGRLSR